MRLIFILIITCFACNNQQPAASQSDAVHANATDTITTAAAPIVLTGCYQMTLKRDSATLDLTIQDTTVTGKLNYIFYQKDYNKGTIKGVLRNDIIYADYTFESEGSTSVREVIFKVEEDTLVPAYGELTQKDNKIIFSNKEDLHFNDRHPFIKVACPH
jgi:hypothetical protein